MRIIDVREVTKPIASPIRIPDGEKTPNDAGPGFPREAPSK